MRALSAFWITAARLLPPSPLIAGPIPRTPIPAWAHVAPGVVADLHAADCGGIAPPCRPRDFPTLPDPHPPLKLSVLLLSLPPAGRTWRSRRALRRRRGLRCTPLRSFAVLKPPRGAGASALRPAGRRPRRSTAHAGGRRAGLEGRAAAAAALPSMRLWSGPRGAACTLRARIKTAPTGLRTATFPALPRHARRHSRQNGRRACLRGLRAKFGAGGRTAQAPGHVEYPEPNTCICLQGGALAAGRAVLESRQNRVHRQREHVREQGLPEHRAEADLRDARPAGPHHLCRARRRDRCHPRARRLAGPAAAAQGRVPGRRQGRCAAPIGAAGYGRCSLRGPGGPGRALDRPKRTPPPRRKRDI